MSLFLESCSVLSGHDLIRRCSNALDIICLWLLFLEVWMCAVLKDVSLVGNSVFWGSADLSNSITKMKGELRSCEGLYNS